MSEQAEQTVEPRFEVEVVRYGQAAAYRDSVYEYLITSNLSEAEVKQKCVTDVRKVDPENEEPGASHNGTCGFPFGLSAFYSFHKTRDCTFRYTVTSPYCD